jgi:predicted choloylglycine hydrolase
MLTSKRTQSYKYIMNKDKLSHLEENNMTWRQHFVFAMSIVVKLYTAILYLSIHAIFPEIYKKEASSLIRSVNSELEK